jgi:hypothetical protein
MASFVSTIFSLLFLYYQVQTCDIPGAASPVLLPKRHLKFQDMVNANFGCKNKRVKANSHIPCRSPAMPCRAAKGLDCVFPFDLHSAAVFD